MGVGLLVEDAPLEWLRGAILIRGRMTTLENARRKQMTDKVQIIEDMKLKELTRAVSRLIDSPLARRGSIEVSAGRLEAEAPVAVHLEVLFQSRVL